MRLGISIKKIINFVCVCAFVSICLLACADNKPENKENMTENEVVLGEEQEETIQYSYPFTITPTTIDDIDFCIESEDVFLIAAGNGKFGYISKNREELTDFVYDDAYPFSEGLAAASIDGKYGFIDKKGEAVIDFVYDDLKPFSDGLAYYVKEKEYGFLRQDGSVAFRLDCDSVSSFNEGKAYFSIDGKYGYIDLDGQEMVRATYDDADFYQNGIAFISLDGCKGAIDSDGEIVIPIIYDEIERNDGYICAWKEEQTEYYSLNGTSISEDEAAELAEEPENGKAGMYTSSEDGRLTVYDENDKKLISVPCDYDFYGIYQDYSNFIVCNFDSKDIIVLLEDNYNVDLSDVLLKNSITPRKQQFYQAVKEQENSIFSLSEYAEKVKYIDVNDSGNPILYYYVDDLVHTGFPLSSSAFYSLDGNEAKCLLYCEESGGSLRGDYVCFWKEKDTEIIRPGLNGAAGGFGGFDVYRDVYEYESNEITKILSLNRTEWYNSDEIEYSVNDLPVSEEEYYIQDAKYTLFTLY